MEIKNILQNLKINNCTAAVSTGTEWHEGNGANTIASYTPINGELLGTVSTADRAQYDAMLAKAKEAAQYWKNVPAPKRGDIVRQIGEALRAKKDDLGALVSIEMGKSYQEGLGEVQEMIDICEFAVGLSRQLYGLTMHSERPNHRMYEQWHPLGIVGIITAFNFPVAVWSWNAMLALVCGDVCIWKPSSKTPLCALACHQIVEEVCKANNLPEGLLNLIIGDDAGPWISEDPNVALVSFTGSTRVGRTVGQTVAARFGKSILELGGNNAIIVTPSADLSMVLPGVVFGAVGTAGQRCTTTRRLIVHSSIYDKTVAILKNAYSQLTIGTPLDTNNHVGPLIDEDAVKQFENAIATAKASGCNIIIGGERATVAGFENGYYVKPCIIEANNDLPIVQEETFAPILYVMKYEDLKEAIAIQNAVPQGLSSAIFTNDLRESELFLSANGSDCGIANVNIGTSGAEIGGAFGGEKETGGGRESGSDAWRAYMRRQTNTINYGTSLPLAQGIKFDL